ncbi:MAG: hypothetical protein HDT39_07600 [Lachnospiraceae bacterium]|nr:hypothetical protein [Lachnospiraceae bacterium]
MQFLYFLMTEKGRRSKKHKYCIGRSLCEFCGTNGSKRHRRIVEVQKDIPKMMVPLTMELDIKGVLDNIHVNMEGLTFEESIIRLIQMFVFEKRDIIKQRIIEEYKNYF